MNVLMGIRKYFENMSLLHKLTFVYVFAILIPTVSIGSYTYFQSQENVRREIVRSAQQTLQQVKNNIHIKVSIAESLSENTVYKYNVLNFLGRPYSMDVDSFFDYTENIVSLISNIAYSNQASIHKISMYISNPTIPEYHAVIYNEKRLDSVAWYRKFVEENRFSKWIYPNESSTIDAYGSGEGEKVFTLVTRINSATNGQYLGVFTIDILEDTMLAPIKDLYKGAGTFFILDGSNNIIYTSEQIDRGSELTWIKKNIVQQSGYYIENNCLYNYESIPGLNIKIMSKASVENLLKQSGATGRNIILVILAGMVVLFISTYLILKIISGKLRRIVKVMDTVATGNFDVQIPIDSEDEVGQLAKDFNILIHKINELVKDVLKKETFQKDAQITALQYQINPHFIYNTIDTFKTKIQMQGDFDTADALADFGKMLRYNINSKYKYATIKEEMQQVESYINIQKIRLDDRLKLSVNMKTGLGDFKVLKFILQPVVENCIKHGAVDKQKRLEIRMDVFTKGEDVLIEVTDNGAGINSRRLDELNYQLRYSNYHDNINGSDGSIGLSNINERLKLYYGAHYYVTLDSRPGEYTKTVIRIPYRAQEVK